jgi:FKBP-type peptidyl-prolyl cis-trans isomerase
MVNKLEAIGILVCVGVMALALFLLRMEENSSLLGSLGGVSQQAAIVVADEAGSQDLASAIGSSMSKTSGVTRLIIDDIVMGEGDAVTSGDTLTVHYIGTLQNGQQFDNSYVRGKPFSFTLGKGQVIKGWDEGLLGMKKGGQRIIVIPSELAYGKLGMGTIPSNATLVFAVELVDIK